MQAIELNKYNIRGNILNTAKFEFDLENHTVKTPSGNIYTVVNDYEFTYKVMKRSKTIKASRGISGFIEFLNDINRKESPFNSFCFNAFQKL